MLFVTHITYHLLKSFDGCYAYALLEHVTNPIKVLNEINRVLKAKAQLKVLVPTDSLTKSYYVTNFLSFKFKDIIRLSRLSRLVNINGNTRNLLSQSY